MIVNKKVVNNMTDEEKENVIKANFKTVSLPERVVQLFVKTLCKSLLFILVACAYIGICTITNKLLLILFLGLFVFFLGIHIIYNIYGRVKCLMSKNPKIRKLAKKL